MNLADGNDVVISGDVRFLSISIRNVAEKQGGQDAKRSSLGYHYDKPTRAHIRYPETRNTKISDSGRKIFQPSRISWS